MSSVIPVIAVIPVADELLHLDGSDVALLGSRCSGCGTYYFPRPVSCRNPDCDDKDLADAQLGRTGELYSWTVQHYRPPALFRVEDWQACAHGAVGLVELPEGLRVLAILTGAEPGQIPIGTAMRLTTLALFTDDNGNAVVTYAYEPAAGRESS